MKTNSLSILFFASLSANALRIPFHQPRRQSLQRRSFGNISSKIAVVNAENSEGTVDLNTVQDLLYMANITIGGAEYVVQLDTGSSDLWIKADSFPMSNVSHTNTQFNLTYGIGWAYGNITTAEVEFSGITIPKQAFIDASSATNPALSYGADGILGLGFTSLSNIDKQVNSSGGDWGRSVLYNSFLDKPDEENYITFALQRTDDGSDDVQGAFTVGEIDSNYTDIQSSNAISTWPVSSPSRWNVLLDAFMVSSSTYTVSTNVTDAPSDNAVVLLDSGTSYSYCTTDVAQAIYGGISGATYDSSEGLWVVPCDAEVDMALQFGNDIFPLHPLDLVVKANPSSSSSTCIGTFIPQTISIGSDQFDWLLGDNVLRSLYTMYDFGDFDSNGMMGNPYIKLLSLTDPDTASAEFAKARGSTARTGITYNASNSTSGTANVSVAGSTADKLAQLVNYIPAMLAILGLNALALLVVAGVGIMYLCKRRHRKSKKERNLLALSNRTPTPFPSQISSGDGSAHRYERVADNIPSGEQEPEDMPFVPPAPAFHAFGHDSLRPLPAGSRPRSAYSGIPPQPQDYRISAAGSDVTAFVPPSPSYMKKDMERPKSVA